MIKPGKVPKEFNLFDYLYSVYRHKYAFFVIFAIVVVLSIFYSYIAKKKYTSSALILFEQEKVTNPLERQIADRLRAEKMTEKLKTIRQIILSRSKLMQVIRKMDLDLNLKTPLEQEELIGELKESIEISMVSDSLYSISYEGDEPSTVRDIVNTISDLFIEEHLEKLRGTANDAFTFINSQLEVYKKKLEDSENALRLFKQTNIGQLPGEENVNLTNLTKYQNLVSEAEFELKEAVLQKSMLEEQLSKEKPRIVAFNSIEGKSSLELQLAHSELELASLLTTYTDNYPEVIRLKSQIEEMRRIEEVRREVAQKTTPDTGLKTEAINPSYQKIKEDLGQINIKISSLQSRMNDYAEKIKYYGAKVESIPKQEQELAQLNRDYEANAHIYNTLLNKLEEARISRELEMKEKSINFQVVDPAQLPLIPSKPNRPRLILLGIALGLAAGFLILCVPYYMDNSITGLDAARTYFDYPVLVGIPIITLPDDISRKRIKNLVFFSLVGLFMIFVSTVICIEIMNRYQPSVDSGLNSLSSAYQLFRQLIEPIRKGIL